MTIFAGGAWLLLGLAAARRWVTLGSKGNSSLSSFCLCRVPAPRGGYLYNFLTAAEPKRHRHLRSAGRPFPTRSFRAFGATRSPLAHGWVRPGCLRAAVVRGG